MKITELLKPSFILGELQSQTKREVLAELLTVFEMGGEGAAETMLQSLLEREKLGSTGIGDGIAIPHGKIVDLQEMTVAFGRSRQGIDFEAMDGCPVHLFFLLLAPEHSAGLHLKALAKISRMLKDAQFRQQLIEAGGAEEIFSLILQKDEET